MITTRQSSSLSIWHTDFVVFTAETIVLAGSARPMSLGVLTVENCQVRALMHTPIDWTHPGPACVPAGDTEWERALPTLISMRRLTADDLYPGMDPYEALGLAHHMLALAARRDVLIVAPTTSELEVILDAIPRWLGMEAPDVNAISAAVLERARRHGLLPRPGERSIDFYRRATSLTGPLPALPDTLGPPFPDDLLTPEDRTFPAMATSLRYLSLMRLFRSDGR